MNDQWNERDRDEALIWVKPDGSVEISDYRLAPNRKAELDSVKHDRHEGDHRDENGSTWADEHRQESER